MSFGFIIDVIDTLLHNIAPANYDKRNIESYVLLD